MKQKLKALGISLSCSAMNWVSDHIIAPTLDSDYVSLRVRFGWWLESQFSSLFGWCYASSDHEAQDAIEWASDWILFDQPIRWDFLNQRQTEIVILEFGIGPIALRSFF